MRISWYQNIEVARALFIHFPTSQFVQHSLLERELVPFPLRIIPIKLQVQGILYRVLDMYQGNVNMGEEKVHMYVWFHGCFDLVPPRHVCVNFFFNFHRYWNSLFGGYGQSGVCPEKGNILEIEFIAIYTYMCEINRNVGNDVGRVHEFIASRMYSVYGISNAWE